MTDKRLPAVIVGTLLMGACFAQQKTASKQSSVYKYDTSGIRLEGVLTQRKVYGPPGYGETPRKDEKSTILILMLAHRITVVPTADAEEKNSASLAAAKNAREVQLFVARDKSAQAHAMLGKRVVAVGVLNEAVAPSQYTKVSLDVETLVSK